MMDGYNELLQTTEVDTSLPQLETVDYFEFTTADAPSEESFETHYAAPMAWETMDGAAVADAIAAETGGLFYVIGTTTPEAVTLMVYGIGQVLASIPDDLVI